MITDRQVKKLWKLSSGGLSLVKAAARCDMDEKTARKYRYRYAGKLPSELAQPHTWRTREDPFQEVWQGVCEQLAENPGLQAKTLFEWLQRQYPGRFQDGQLRTFQRGVKRWRVTQGPPKEVFFSQVHQPGRLCASDFTHMTSLEVTIGGQPFEHLAYLLTAVQNSGAGRPKRAPSTVFRQRGWFADARRFGVRSRQRRRARLLLGYQRRRRVWRRGGRIAHAHLE